MSLRSNSLGYRAGEVCELLETLANAARHIRDAGGNDIPRDVGNLADCIDLAAHLASGVFTEMEKLIGPAVNEEGDGS